MRKLFMTLIVASAALTLVLGVAFAWTSSATGSWNASTGSLSVALYNPTATGNALYPNVWTDVATGQIQNNTLANPGVPVYITGGTVTSGLPCVDSGALTVTDASAVNPGGWAGGGWKASLHMPYDAPDSCQGGTVGYSVTVNVSTP